MSVEVIRPRDFLTLAASKATVLDVRSPGEYVQGHIPGAVSFPLFTDAERAEIGTIYKQQGKQPAIKRGLEIVGPKLHTFVCEAEKLWEQNKDLPLLVHCWRGGMRSGSMAWLLSTAGIPVKVMRGGYKGYRNYIRHQFSLPAKILVLGGLTGSGKTAILKHLEGFGLQVLDLEGLAHHKGSAFGPLGQEPQPSTEQFENDCFEQWQFFDRERLIIVEGESPNIGKVRINDSLLNQMRFGALLVVELERELRLDRIMKEYGHFDLVDLIDTTKRIEKKLGGQNAKQVVELLQSNQVRQAADILLGYYDRTYWHALKKKGTQWIDHLILKSVCAEENARVVLKRINQYILESQGNKGDDHE